MKLIQSSSRIVLLSVVLILFLNPQFSVPGYNDYVDFFETDPPKPAEGADALWKAFTGMFVLFCALCAICAICLHCRKQRNGNYYEIIVLSNIEV